MPKDAEIDNLEMDEMGAMIKKQITGSNFWVMDEMGWNEGNMIVKYDEMKVKIAHQIWGFVGLSTEKECIN